MDSNFLYGVILGLVYAYVGLLVVLLTLDFADSAVSKCVDDSLLKSFLLLVSWVVAVPWLLCASWFKLLRKRYKALRLV